jgi:hypothetical protein
VIGRFSAEHGRGDTYQNPTAKPSTAIPRPTPAYTFTSSSNMSRPLSLFSVQAILVLAIDDGSRILPKYYSNPHPPAGVHSDFPGQIAYKTVKDQKAFEKGLLGVLREDNASRAGG